MKSHLLVLGTLLIIVGLAPILTSHDPMRSDEAASMQPPSGRHWLGTDQLGRDVWSRALYGGRHTLLVAIMATLTASIPGIGVGLLAAMAKGIPERMIMAILNSVLAVPGLLFGLVVLTLLGQGAVPLVIATGLAQIAPLALVTRSAAQVINSMTYVEAARALGATRWQIVTWHTLPNVQPTVLAYVSVVFGYTIINSTAFNFLGLGGEPGIPDWGVMLAEGRATLRAAPWIAIVPGLAITLTVFVVNSLADHLASRHR